MMPLARLHIRCGLRLWRLTRNLFRPFASRTGQIILMFLPVAVLFMPQGWAARMPGGSLALQIIILALLGPPAVWILFGICVRPDWRFSMVEHLVTSRQNRVLATCLGFLIPLLLILVLAVAIAVAAWCGYDIQPALEPVLIGLAIAMASCILVSWTVPERWITAVTDRLLLRSTITWTEAFARVILRDHPHPRLQAQARDWLSRHATTLPTDTLVTWMADGIGAIAEIAATELARRGSAAPQADA